MKEDLHDINGVPIHELERRMRPIKYQIIEGEKIRLFDEDEKMPEGLEEDEEIPAIVVLRSMRSALGYIGSNESLETIISNGKQLLSKLKIESSLILANELKSLLKEFNNHPSHSKEIAIPIETFEIKHTTTLENIENKEQRYVITHCYIRGDPKINPFINLQKYADQSWTDEFHIYNLNLPSLVLKLRGNDRFGSIYNMENYDFYEGKCDWDNPFYNPPHKILSVLQGKYVNGDTIQDEIDKENAFLENLVEKDLLNFSNQIQSLKNNISQVKNKMSILKQSSPKNQENEELESLEYSLEEHEGDLIYYQSEIKETKKRIEESKQYISYLNQEKEKLSI